MKPYKENCPAPGSHVFQATGTIFELVQNIIGTNLLTKFHDDRTINMASRVLTRFYYSYITKNATPLDSHVFTPTGTIFKLSQRDHWKNALPPGGYVFLETETIFKLIKDIIGTNLLTKFMKIGK
ncbi:hypothetical protein DPMN_115735 [Dreissena polymorpha]|uniref:Uncharacterized protein n=1 Tax=Dreissena polymorpha TaxID=45954 RepID=A0A9D4KMG7_DREPO|nr:hypothetical protein DPMN_115735 [Dreissena polymorpha]